MAPSNFRSIVLLYLPDSFAEKRGHLSKVVSRICSYVLNNRNLFTTPQINIFY